MKRLFVLLAAVAACSSPPPEPTASVAQSVLTPIVAPAEGGVFNGTTSGSSQVSGTCGQGTASAPEKVYQWTAPRSGSATFMTCGGQTAFDTVVYLRKTTISGSQLACVDDSTNCTIANGQSWASRVVLSVTAGTTYFAFVDGYGSMGNYTFTLIPPPGGPADASAEAGQDAAGDVSDGASDAAGDVVAEGTEASDARDSSESGDDGDGGQVEGGSDVQANNDGGGEEATGSDSSGGDSGGFEDGDSGLSDAGDSGLGDSGDSGGAVAAYPLKKQAGARYLVDQQGNPFLIQGDSAWSLVANTTYEDALTYLDDRKARGFNTIVVNLVEHHFSSNPPKNVYGDAPFLVSGDISTPNEAYFARADAVIRAAGDRGIQVLLFPLYLGDNGGGEGWWAELSSSGAAKATAYGTFVGSRYASFPGIFWVMGGDYTPPDGASGKGLVEAMANAIKASDPNHLMTEHGSSWRTASLADYAGQPWLDVDAVYTRETAGAIGPDVLGQYTRADWLPTFLIESGYENELTTASDLRRQSYETLLNGGMGQVWGASPVWCFETGGTCIYSGGGTNWHTSLGTASTQDQTRVWALFSVRPWWKLVPQTFLTAGGSGVSIERASDGTWGAAYLPSSHSVTIGLGNFSQPVSVSWFNPSTGAFTTVAGSPFVNSGSLATSPPSSGDWVLVVE
jgi:hypothetical protein